MGDEEVLVYRTTGVNWHSPISNEDWTSTESGPANWYTHAPWRAKTPRSMQSDTALISCSKNSKDPGDFEYSLREPKYCMLLTE